MRNNIDKDLDKPNLYIGKLIGDHHLTGKVVSFNDTDSSSSIKK